jgi:cell division protein FtsB
MAASLPPAPARNAAGAAPTRAPLGRRIVVFVVAALALAVLIGTAMGDRGFLEARRRRAEGAQLLKEVDRLNAEDAALMAQVTALKAAPYAVEKIAREKLGYAKPGEVIYLFPPHETKPNEEPETGETSGGPTY